MKSLSRLFALVAILAGLTLATGVAYAGQLEQLAGMLSPGLGFSPDAQDFMDIDLRNSDAQQKSNSSGVDDDGEVEIIGTVTSITTDTLVVDDTAIAITAETEFEDEVAVGDMVKVEAFYADDGTLTALKVELYGEDDDDEVEIIGTITSITTDTLVVDDTAIAITGETIFEDEVAVGDMVKVEAFYADDGTLTAKKVELYGEDDDDEIEIIGTVTSITTDTLVVDSTVIAITPETIFEDEVAVGDMVKVEAFYADDGTLTAKKVELYGDDDDDEYFKIVGVVTSITTDTLVVSDTVIAITPETIFKDEVAVGDMVKVIVFYADDGTLTAFKVFLLDGNGFGPGYGHKNKVKVVGIVDSFSLDSIVVSGIPISVTEQTKIVGNIEVGDVVRVHAFLTEDGSLVAWKIKWLPDAVANPGQGDKIVMGGVVESLTSDTIVVSGVGFAISADTDFKGDVGVGDAVKVYAYTSEDGTVTARRIVELRDGNGDMDGSDRGSDDKRGREDSTDPASDEDSQGNGRGKSKDKTGGNDWGGGKGKGHGKDK